VGGRILVLAFGLTQGCLNWSSLYQKGGDGGPGDPTVSRDEACSDGTREALVGFPNIAACAGAWDYPGIVDLTPPLCGHSSGNDSQNPDGIGCGPADLCAIGWHVCSGAMDVQNHDDGSACTQLELVNDAIFVTRQRGAPPNGICVSSAATGGDRPPPPPPAVPVDDVFGCGSIGIMVGDCAPLARKLSLPSDCPAPFDCGQSPDSEGNQVVKSRSDRGGVLCCRD
jgi:hypothetical protein